MHFVSAPYGSCILNVSKAGVHVTPGASVGKLPSRKILNPHFTVAGKVYSVVSVHKPYVNQGYIHFTVVGHSESGLQAFKFENNPYEEYSHLTANASGQIYSSGHIALLDDTSLPPRTLSPTSVVYDESLDRILYESHSTTGKDVGIASMGWNDQDAETTAVYVEPAGVNISDCILAYLPDGTSSVVFGAYDLATKCTQIYDGFGNPVLKVAGRPDSAYGLRSTDSEGDMFDIVLFYSNGEYHAVNVDTNVPGDIEAVWFTDLPGEGTNMLHIVANDGGVRILTNLMIETQPTQVYVYTNTHRNTYDATDGSLMISEPAPSRLPYTAVATPEGHVTAMIEPEGSVTQVVFGRVVGSTLVAEYPVPYPSEVLPQADQRLTRLGANVSFGGVTVPTDFSFAATAPPDQVQLLSGQWTLLHDKATGELSVEDDTGSHVFPLQGDLGEDPVHFLPNDDTFGGFVWFRTASGSGLPTYRIELVTFVPNVVRAASGYLRQVLVSSTTTYPTYCDTVKSNGELFIVSSGNWLTNEQDKIGIYHVDDSTSETPTLTVVGSVDLEPTHPIVEQLRAEGDTVVWTAEPHPGDSVGTRLEAVLASESESPTVGTHWMKQALDPEVSYTDLVVDAIICVMEHGAWQSYIAISNVPDAVNGPISVTVGTTMASIPMNETRVFHLATVPRGWSTYNAVSGLMEPDATRAIGDIGTIPFDVPGIAAGSTIGSVFFPGGMGALDTSYVRHHSIFGITQPNSAKLSIYNLESENLEVIDYPTSSVRAFAISQPPPVTTVQSVLFK